MNNKQQTRTNYYYYHLIISIDAGAWAFFACFTKTV